MIWPLGLALGAAVAVAVPIARLSRRYRKMFSDGHMTELYERFTRALVAVEAASQASPGDAVAKDAFVTSAQLAIVVTKRHTDGRWVLHVSLSQPPGRTTKAVGQRFGFLLVTILDRNKLQLTPFVTASGVRHLVFAWDGAPLVTNDLASVTDRYRTSYRPLPFVHK